MAIFGKNLRASDLRRTGLAGVACGLALLLAFSIGTPAPAADAGAIVLQNDGIMLQAWYFEQKDYVSPPESSWWLHLTEKMPEFRRLGVTGLWVPSPTKAAGGGFSAGYDAYDLYDLGSKDQRGTIPTRWGSKEEFLNMIAVAHGNGIDIYPDIVVNHRAGGNDDGYSYSPIGAEGPGRFPMAPWDFHRGGQGDWDMDLGGGRDIAHELPAVRDQFHRWIRWFDKQTDTDGYRIDAAKHMDPGFIEGLLYQVQEGSGKWKYAVSEFYDGNPWLLSRYVNDTRRRSAVFDFTLFFRLVQMTSGGGYWDMRGLRERFWDEEKSSPFFNNHDTFERANGLHIFHRTHMAAALVLGSTGYSSIYWKDLYDSQGNLRPYLVNLMWIRHVLARGRFVERWADQDLYVFERQGNLLVGLNDHGHAWRTEWVRTDFGPNRKLHDYALGVGDVWTNEHGWARISIPPGGYVCYAPDGQQGRIPWAPPRRTVQEYEGNVDMDLARAGEFWGPSTRFVAEPGEPIKVDVWLQDRSLAVHVALFDRDGNRLNHERGVGHVFLEYNNPAERGYYQVRIGLEQTGQGRRTPYWMKLDYMGAQRRPHDVPPRGNAGHDLLPLTASSTGP